MRELDLPEGGNYQCIQCAEIKDDTEFLQHNEHIELDREVCIDCHVLNGSIEKGELCTI